MDVSVYADTAAAMLVATSEAVTPPVLAMLMSPSTSDRDTFVPALIFLRVVPVRSSVPVEPELLLKLFCLAFSSAST